MPLLTESSGSRDTTIVPFERGVRAHPPRIESILILLEQAPGAPGPRPALPLPTARRPRRRPPVSCGIHPFTTEPPPEAA